MRAQSVAIIGVEPHLVDVEAEVNAGALGLTIDDEQNGAYRVDLQQVAERVQAGLAASGPARERAWPGQFIVSLSGAAEPRRRSHHDLAAAVLAATGQAPAHQVEGRMFLGAVGPGEAIGPVAGVLPSLLGAVRAGHHEVVVAARNAAEAAELPGIAVMTPARLRKLSAVLRAGAEPDGWWRHNSARRPLAATDHVAAARAAAKHGPDMADVRGRPSPVRRGTVGRRGPPATDGRRPRLRTPPTRRVPAHAPTEADITRVIRHTEV